MLLAYLILMQTSPTPALDVAVFAQYGVLGVSVVALAMFARSAYNREKDRADRAEAKVELLLEGIQKEYTPTLIRANDLMTHQVLPLLIELKDLPKTLDEFRRDFQKRRAGS